MNKQKSITVLSVLLALVIACSTSIAMAEVVVNHAEGEITYVGSGIVWMVDINAEGITYDEIESATAWIVTPTNPHGDITVRAIAITQDKVWVVLARNELPSTDVEVLSSGLAIVLKNGDVWLFTGPAFTSSFRPR